MTFDLCMTLEDIWIIFTILFRYFQSMMAPVNDFTFSEFLFHLNRCFCRLTLAYLLSVDREIVMWSSLGVRVGHEAVISQTGDPLNRTFLPLLNTHRQIRRVVVLERDFLNLNTSTGKIQAGSAGGEGGIGANNAEGKKLFSLV